MVYLIDLPYSCGGFVRKNEDGTHTILLNAKLSNEENRRTFLHEISHIDGNDFDIELQADLLERLRHEQEC